MAEDRFATVDEEELQQILLDKDSVNTRRNTKSSVKLFRSYLKAKSLDECFEESDERSLNTNLSKFYAEMRQENGEKYKKSSMIAIRHGMNRFLQTNTTCDIVNGQAFKESKRVFDAAYMPYFSGAILGFSLNFSGTNDIFLGQILQNSGTLSGTF